MTINHNYYLFYLFKFPTVLINELERIRKIYSFIILIFIEVLLYMSIYKQIPSLKNCILVEEEIIATYQNLVKVYAER